MLAISTKQLRLLTSAGEIRYVNIGLGCKRETRRYMPEDVQQFIEKRRQWGGAAPRIPFGYIDVGGFHGLLEARRRKTRDRGSSR